MKTETEAAPAVPPAANLTVQQLGRALTPKPATDQNNGDETSPPAESEAESDAPPANRERPASDDTEQAEETATDLSQNETSTETEGAEAEGTEAEVESEAAPAKAELPKELADAMELAKGDGKKGVADLLKRVHKLVDERDTNRNARLQMEERVNQLETELETARSQKPEAQSHSNGSTHPAVAQVSQALAEVDGFIKLFKQNPDGVELDNGNGSKVTLDADQVAEHLDRLRDKRTELLTERKLTEGRVREHFEQTYQQAHATAVKKFPWVADPKTDERQRMDRILKQMPELKRFPDYELVIGYYFKGLAAEEAASARPVPKKAPAQREPTQVNDKPPSAGAQPQGAKAVAQREVKELEKKFRESGKQDDLKRLESAKRRLSRL